MTLQCTACCPALVQKLPGSYCCRTGLAAAELANAAPSLGKHSMLAGSRGTELTALWSAEVAADGSLLMYCCSSCCRPMLGGPCRQSSFGRGAWFKCSSIFMEGLAVT